MSVKKKLENSAKKLFRKVELKLGVKTKIAIGLLVGLAVLKASAPLLEKNDVAASSVMITNVEGTSGGTGVILRSTTTKTEILTNSHVCRVVENGGTVSGKAGTYLVSSYKHSKAHDICLLTVDANMGVNTKVSNRAPVPYYEKAIVSGHPALMPNVMTSGHFSGRKVISVMTGVSPCTKEDEEDPAKGLLCLLAGGLPDIRRYESVLVTATIMPGSSGSGVYNEDDELVGLAFAGSGELGYAWTVPYEALKNFLSKEQQNLEAIKPSNKVDLFNKEQNKRRKESEVMENLKKACATDKAAQLKDVCELISNDMVWHKK